MYTYVLFNLSSCVHLSVTVIHFFTIVVLSLATHHVYMRAYNVMNTSMYTNVLSVRIVSSISFI